MMRSLRLSVLLTGLLAAAACGTTQDTGSVLGTDPGGSVTSTMLPSRVGPPPTQPNLAQPDPRAAKLRPISWTRAVAGPGQQLVVDYTISGLAQCSTLGRVTSTETDQTVTITVYVGQLPGANCTGDQPMLAASFQTTVTLRQPLGTRTVTDGAPPGSG